MGGWELAAKNAEEGGCLERGNTHTLLITTRSTLVTVNISHSSAYHSVEQLMEGILEHGSLHRPVQRNVVHRGSVVHGELKIKVMLTHNISFKPQLITKML